MVHHQVSKHSHVGPWGPQFKLVSEPHRILLVCWLKSHFEVASWLAIQKHSFYSNLVIWHLYSRTFKRSINFARWAIVFLVCFERSPPKLNVPNQKWTGLSTPYTTEFRLQMSQSSVTQVEIRHASHAGNLMQGPICLFFCHHVESMRAFCLPPIVESIEHWKLRLASPPKQ